MPPDPLNIPRSDTAHDAYETLSGVGREELLTTGGTIEDSRRLYRLQKDNDGSLRICDDTGRHAATGAEPSRLHDVLREILSERRIQRLERKLNDKKSGAAPVTSATPSVTKADSQTSWRPTAMLGLFSSWAGSAATNASVQVTNAVGLVCGGSAIADANIGLGVTDGTMGFSLIEAAVSSKDFADAAIARSRIELNRARHREGRDRFVRDASRPTMHRRDASDYLEYRHASVEAQTSNRGLRVLVVAFLRDGMLQLASVANKTAGAARMLAQASVHVSATAVGYAGSAFSIASGALHFVQGFIEHRAASGNAKRAVMVRYRMESASENDFAKLAELADDKISKVVKYKGAKDAVSETELEHAHALYGEIARLFIDNNAREEANAELAMTRAKLRMTYGVAAAVIGGTGLALTIAAAGGPVGIAVVTAVGAALGAAWLGFAVYKAYSNRRDAREQAERQAQQKQEAASLASGFDLANAETSFVEAGTKNGYVAAAIVARHLGFGKARPLNGAVATSGAAPDAPLAQAVMPQANPVNAVERFLSKTATRFLLNMGMNRDDVKALKQLAKDPDAQNDVQANIERFLLGSSARVRAVEKPAE
jgi:hypothetical protein